MGKSRALMPFFRKTMCGKGLLWYGIRRHSIKLVPRSLCFCTTHRPFGISFSPFWVSQENTRFLMLRACTLFLVKCSKATLPLEMSAPRRLLRHAWFLACSYLPRLYPFQLICFALFFSWWENCCEMRFVPVSMVRWKERPNNNGSQTKCTNSYRFCL